MLRTWFEDLDDYSLMILRVYPFVNFRVLASSNLLYDLIVVLSSIEIRTRQGKLAYFGVLGVNLPELDFKIFIICIIRRVRCHLLTNVSIVFGWHPECN